MARGGHGRGARVGQARRPRAGHDPALQPVPPDARREPAHRAAVRQPRTRPWGVRGQLRRRERTTMDLDDTTELLMESPEPATEPLADPAPQETPPAPENAPDAATRSREAAGYRVRLRESAATVAERDAVIAGMR